VESNLPASRVWTPEEIAQACQGELHPLAIRGIQSYNAGDYFAAHEELELAWREERGPVRDLYHGILQVGLGYYHILRLNYRGAVKMFLRCRQWLDPFPSTCRGVDVDTLRADFLRAEAELFRLGPGHLERFNPTLLRPVRFVRDPEAPQD
jgi:predicted metal-dependent hydrolase